MPRKEHGKLLLAQRKVSQPRYHRLVLHPSRSVPELGFAGMSPGRSQGLAGGHSLWSLQAPSPPIPVTHPWDGWGQQTQLCLGFRRSRAVSARLGGCCGEGAAGATPPAPLACPVAQSEAPGLFLALLPCSRSPSPHHHPGVRHRVVLPQ